MRLWYRNIERAPGVVEPRIIIEQHGRRDHAREATIIGACVFRTSPLGGPPPHSWIEVADSAQVTFTDRVTEPIHGY